MSFDAHLDRPAANGSLDQIDLDSLRIQADAAEGSDRFRLLIELSDGLSARHELGDALVATSEAAVVAEEVNDDRLRAIQAASVGDIMANLGRTDSAKASLTRAIGLANKAGFAGLEMMFKRNLADVLAEAGATDEAVAYLDEAQRFAEEEGNFDDRVRCMSIRGKIVRRRDPRAAAAVYLDLLELTTAHGALAEAADAHELYADVCDQVGDHATAATHFSDAASLKELLGFDHDAGLAIGRAALALALDNRVDEAISAHLAAAAKFEAIDHPHYAAMARTAAAVLAVESGETEGAPSLPDCITELIPFGPSFALGSAFATLARVEAEGDFADEATGTYQAASVIFKAIGNAPGYVEVECERAELVSKAGRPKAAIRRLLAVKRELGEDMPIEILRPLEILLGGIYFDHDRMRGARKHYERAIEIAEQIGAEVSAGEFLDLGRILTSLACFDEAEVAIERARCIYEGLGDGANVAWSIYFLGCATQYRRDFALAMRYFEEALALFEAEDDATAATHCTDDIGTCIADLGDPARGLPQIESAISTYAELSLPRDEAIARLHAADALRSLGRLDESLCQIEAARSLYQVEETPRDLALCDIAKGKCLTARGELDSAISTLRQAVASLRPGPNWIPVKYDAQVALGDALRADGKADEARRVFSNARRIASRHGIRGVHEAA